MVEGR